MLCPLERLQGNKPGKVHRAFWTLAGRGSLGHGGLRLFPVWPVPSPHSPDGLASLGPLRGDM